MQQREKLLNTYGFDVMDADEDGNLIYREKKVVSMRESERQEEKDPLDGVNENVLRVKMIEKKKVNMELCADELERGYEGTT